MWICKNTYYQAILCEHAPPHSLLFASISIFRAINSPVTGFPLPLSDTPQHWLQPLISNQAWACVSCSSIYSRPANRHKSTSKISLRTISFKRSFRRFSETTREMIRTDASESISLRQNSTESPSPRQSCQRFGGALKKRKKRRRKKWFKSIRKGLFILWEAPVVWSGVGLCSDCCKESDEPVNQEEGWHHCSAPYLWAELLRRAAPLLCWSV